MLLAAPILSSSHVLLSWSRNKRQQEQDQITIREERPSKTLNGWNTNPVEIHTIKHVHTHTSTRLEILTKMDEERSHLEKHTRVDREHMNILQYYSLRLQSFVDVLTDL